MKRMLPVLFALIMLFAPGLRGAGAETKLPRGVYDLYTTRYPSYRLAQYDGWGDDTQGQFALILSDSRDTLLAIAEKTPEDAAYVFTVENTNAVREGEDFPSVLIDTGGDSLFYAYHDDLYTVTYHSVKQGGEWGAVSVETIDTSFSDYDANTWTGLQGSSLCYSISHFDKLENHIPGSDVSYMPIPVSGEYAAQMKLAAFDIGMVSPEPHFIQSYPGLCAPLLDSGETLLQADVQQDTLIMLLATQDGKKRLRIADADYGLITSGPLPQAAVLDAYHADDGSILLVTDGGASVFGFTRGWDGLWRLTTVQSEETFGFCHDGVDLLDKSLPYRNDGVAYGLSPWNADLTQLDLTALPRTFKEALSRLDRSAYAVVCNPDPADRLHLRAEPKRGADSLGKFYNNTPVLVLGDLGDWVHVRIGSEQNGLEGYMMKQYLRLRQDNAEAVACVFPQLHMVYDSVPLRSEPNVRTTPLCSIKKGFRAYYLIGVMGDEWYVVMTPDGTVGYALQSDFWEGNG